jgi:hypothetical protein
MGNFANYFFFKAGALQPVFTVDIYAADGVTPLDLSLTTGAKFRLRAETGTSLLINNAVPTLSGTTKSHLEYDWNAGDWTPVAGRYLAEAEFDFVASSPLVVPVVGYWHVIVSPTLP